MSLHPRVRERIELLGLAPHPEGGFYRELFRSAARVAPADGRGERAALTAIHFLLAGGAHSRWHAVRSDEQWTFLEGEPLELFVLEAGARVVRRVVLGPLSESSVPTLVVPAGAWQAARATGLYALVACTVGPGFDFADFRLLAEDAAERRRIAELAPELAGLLGEARLDVGAERGAEGGVDGATKPAARTVPEAIARLARERDLEIALLVRAGSKAYGLELASSDDDYLGVFVPRLRELVSIRGLAAETHAGNDPDYTLHEIGKFCALALKGNPAILETLWNPEVLAETRWGARLRELRSRCLHRGSLEVYVDYAEAQLRKMAKGKGLHAKGGTYNAKYGTHILRLLHAGLHLGRKHEVMVRVPAELAAELLRVRRGELGAADVAAKAGPLLDELRELAASSSLPDAPAAAAFDDLVAAARLSRT
jgi:hypothetical protein